MVKRKWTGDPLCRFCHENQTVHHLSFSCFLAKYVWSTIGKPIDARDSLGCFTQYLLWLPRFIPRSRNLHMVGRSTICWEIWKHRNRPCFRHKLVKSPAEFICYGLHTLYIYLLVTLLQYFSCTCSISQYGIVEKLNHLHPPPEPIYLLRQPKLYDSNLHKLLILLIQLKGHALPYYWNLGVYMLLIEQY